MPLRALASGRAAGVLLRALRPRPATGEFSAMFGLRVTPSTAARQRCFHPICQQLENSVVGRVLAASARLSSACPWHESFAKAPLQVQLHVTYRLGILCRTHPTLVLHRPGVPGREGSRPLAPGHFVAAGYRNNRRRGILLI